MYGFCCDGTGGHGLLQRRVPSGNDTMIVKSKALATVKGFVTRALLFRMMAAVHSLS
jgi:hypothetical protein